MVGKKEDSNSSIPFKEKSKEWDNETSSNDRRILMKASHVFFEEEKLFENGLIKKSRVFFFSVGEY